MSKIFITSDLHLGHEKLALMRGFKSVADHDNAIIKNINETVGSKRHTLWILGDIAFGAHNVERLHEVECVKKIVLGNHDTYRTQFYLDVCNRVYGAFTFKGQYLLTHVPVSTCQAGRFLLNFHGHTHQRKLDPKFYFNVCLEQNNLKPFNLTDLIQSMGPDEDDYKV